MLYEVITFEAIDDQCDGIDDNCNGETDEDYVGEVVACGTGYCASTAATTCVGGVEVDNCVEGPPLAPNDTTCNGVDDDCDGAVDDDYLVAQITCGQGVCTAAGQRFCVEGATVDQCTPGTPTATEDATCNGLDEDCDGQADDDYQPTATSCGLGA